MKKMMALFLLLSACATSVPFKKNGAEFGYKIKDGAMKETFEVQLSLNTTPDENTIAKYMAKAVGEECSERGFEYFDYTDMQMTAEGFCYKDNVKKSLAVTFKKEGLDKTPQEFIISDLNSKSKTFFKLGDIITKISGKSATTLAALRSQTMHAGLSGKTSLPVEIKRDGKTLKFEEPIALFTGASFGPKDLLSLRRSLD
jgi:hypothetical protein